MKILKEANLDEAAKILKDGGIIAFPTETVFGLGVIYDNKTAYDKLVAVKRRPPDKPFTMMLANPEDVKKYCKPSKELGVLIKTFMPGQFTIVTIAKEGLPSWCVGQTGYVGVRVPDYKNIRDLIRKIGKPLLVPSANRSGEAPANSVEEIVKIFDGELDGVLEGESTSKIPSTVVMLDETGIHVVREGAITLEQIEKAIAKENTK